MRSKVLSLLLFAALFAVARAADLSAGPKANGTAPANITGLVSTNGTAANTTAPAAGTEDRKKQGGGWWRGKGPDAWGDWSKHEDGSTGGTDGSTEDGTDSSTDDGTAEPCATHKADGTWDYSNCGSSGSDGASDGSGGDSTDGSDGTTDCTYKGDGKWGSGCGDGNSDDDGSGGWNDDGNNDGGDWNSGDDSDGGDSSGSDDGDWNNGDDSDGGDSSGGDDSDGGDSSGGDDGDWNNDDDSDGGDSSDSDGSDGGDSSGSDGSDGGDSSGSDGSNGGEGGSTTPTDPAVPSPPTDPAVPSPPTPTDPVPSPPTDPAAPGTAGGCPDIQATLDAHNAARTARGAAALVWNDTLATYAQGVSQTCKFEHSNGPYGENLAMGVATCKEAVDLWLGEAPRYDPANPGFDSNTGHFTQVVWKATTQVGCGLACNIVTCSYDPAGNVEGQFPDNV